MPTLPRTASLGLGSSSSSVSTALGSSPSGISFVFRDLDSLILHDGRRVRLSKLIGHGEFGAVYQGELGIKQVVVKLLKPAFVRTDTEAAFLRECELTASLRHARIVKVVAKGRRPADQHEGDEPFLVLEHAGDRTLRNIVDLTRDDLVPLHELLEVMAQVADGLAFVHHSGIGHFDIKPDNIIIDSQGRATIGDFGLACHQNAATFRSGKGTPTYAPPEAFTDQMSLASDVWSLGVVLYELLTAGTLPFVAVGSQSIGNVVQRLPPAPIAAHYRVPPAVCALIAQMLDKDATRRPTMREVHAALQAAAAQEASPSAAGAQAASTRAAIVPLSPERSSSVGSSSSSSSSSSLPQPPSIASSVLAYAATSPLRPLATASWRSPAVVRQSNLLADSMQAARGTDKRLNMFTIASPVRSASTSSATAATADGDAAAAPPLTDASVELEVAAPVADTAPASVLPTEQSTTVAAAAPARSALKPKSALRTSSETAAIAEEHRKEEAPPAVRRAVSFVLPDPPPNSTAQRPTAPPTAHDLLRSLHRAARRVNSM